MNANCLSGANHVEAHSSAARAGDLVLAAVTISLLLYAMEFGDFPLN